MTHHQWQDCVKNGNFDTDESVWESRLFYFLCLCPLFMSCLMDKKDNVAFFFFLQREIQRLQQFDKRRIHHYMISLEGIPFQMNSSRHEKTGFEEKEKSYWRRHKEWHAKYKEMSRMKELVSNCCLRISLSLIDPFRDRPTEALKTILSRTSMILYSYLVLLGTVVFIRMRFFNSSLVSLHLLNYIHSKWKTGSWVSTSFYWHFVRDHKEKEEDS